MAEHISNHFSADKAFIARLSRLPYLTREEEQNYARRWRNQKDVSAQKQLIESHLRYVVQIAFRFRHYGVPLMDLFSEGTKGLQRATMDFDPERGNRLSTYALWWIKAQMQTLVLEDYSHVKIGTSTSQKVLFFNLRRIKSNLGITSDTLLSDMHVALIAASLKVNPEEVRHMDQRLRGDRSLNTPVTGDEISDTPEWQDVLVSQTPDAREIIIEADESRAKREMLVKGIELANLTARETDIFTQRYLVKKPTSLEELGVAYGVSRERIRQIEVRTFEKVQEAVKWLDHERNEPGSAPPLRGKGRSSRFTRSITSYRLRTLGLNEGV